MCLQCFYSAAVTNSKLDLTDTFNGAERLNVEWSRSERASKVQDGKMLRIRLTRIITLLRIILVTRALRFLVTWSWNKLSRVALGTRMAPHKTAWTLRRVEVWDIVTLLKFHGNRCGYSKDSCDKRRLFFVTRQVFPFLLFTIKYDYTEINSFMSALSTRIVLDDSICSFRYLRDRYLDHDATCSICCKWNSNLCNGSLTKYTTGILEEINWCFCWIVILGTFYWFCSLC